MVTDTSLQPEPCGGITNTEDGSDIPTGLTAGPRAAYGHGFIVILVNSGASRHDSDDAIIPELRDSLVDHKVLEVPQTMLSAAWGQLNDIAQGVFQGHVIDDKGMRRMVGRSCLNAPRQGRNLFSVQQAIRNGVVSIF